MSRLLVLFSLMALSRASFAEGLTVEDVMRAFTARAQLIQNSTISMDYSYESKEHEELRLVKLAHILVSNAISAAGTKGAKPVPTDNLQLSPERADCTLGASGKKYFIKTKDWKETFDGSYFIWRPTGEKAGNFVRLNNASIRVVPNPLQLLQLCPLEFEIGFSALFDTEGIPWMELLAKEAKHFILHEVEGDTHLTGRVPDFKRSILKVDVAFEKKNILRPKSVEVFIGDESIPEGLWQGGRVDYEGYQSTAAGDIPSKIVYTGFTSLAYRFDEKELARGKPFFPKDMPVDKRLRTNVNTFELAHIQVSDTPLPPAAFNVDMNEGTLVYDDITHTSYRFGGEIDSLRKQLEEHKK